MSTLRITLSVLLVAVGAVLAGCEATDDVADDAPRLSRVRITETELLSPPAIGNERTYTPDHEIAFIESNGIHAVGFFLTVSAGTTSELQLRLTDGDASTSTPLVQLAFANKTPAIDQIANTFDAGTLAMLANGTGLYWEVAMRPDTPPLQRRFAVVIPRETLGARMVLEAYASTTSDGEPRGGDRIELARAFFYLTTLGDSVMWGNGLRDENKFSALVAAQIEQELGVRVIRTVHAVSGATLQPNDLDGLCTTNCSGEAPQFFTSIGLQAEAMEHPELVDLILMDGCANDIGLETVLTSQDHVELIAELAHEHCLGDLSNMLIRVRALAPNAPIVVNGYFPFVSINSDLSDVGTWAEANNINIGSIEDLTPGLTAFLDNSQAFQSKTTEAMAAAVNLVNSISIEDPPIAFVDAAYAEENATFASQSWLWGLTADVPLAQQLDITLDLFPEDPEFYARLDLCLNVEVAPQFLGCVYGSVGHPNNAGARAYADGIIAQLRNIGLLPVTADAP
ncbi:MAG: SGNH/GDSL hydrolase family protein [Phycisphaerales bacterium]|nr:SGNH/GDSL hydrolase family protein [Phycisphaerales bacterium]